MTPRLITAAERAAARKDGKPWTGLGDVIASATKALGIKPCLPCRTTRKDFLNKLVPFVDRPPK